MTLYRGRCGKSPTLLISLFNYKGEELLSNHGSLFDTGADYIVTNKSELASLGVDVQELGPPSTTEPLPVELADGRHHLADKYLVTVQIGNQNFDTYLIVIKDKIFPVYIPGKDMLKTGFSLFRNNNLIITLNTPNNEIVVEL